METFQLASVFFWLVFTEGRSELTTCGQQNQKYVPLMTHSATSDDHWPWQAAIYHHGLTPPPEYKCGGTVINSNTILSAAHCVLVEKEKVKVYLGRLNLDEEERSSAQNFQVAEIVLHPHYDSISVNNDIAIIRLASNAEFNQYVQPICLWSSHETELSEIVGKSGMVVGWGTTETGQLSKKLRQAALPVIASDRCLISNREGFRVLLSNTSFCAGFGNGTNPCHGDSGGSMSFDKDGFHYIRGIVSASPVRDCAPEEYTKFTDVAQYLPWIKNLTGCEMKVQCVSTLENKFRVSKYEIKVEGPKQPNRQISSNILPLETNADTQTHAWPWHATIYHYVGTPDHKYKCGGSVISPNSVLTAAHCVSIDKNRISVHLGRLDLAVSGNTTQTFEVAEIFRHPEFSTIDYNNDIAIVRLSANATFNKYVQPICIWHSNEVNAENIGGLAGMIISLGAKERSHKSNTLRHGYMTVVADFLECFLTNRIFISKFIGHKNFCATTRNGTGVCFGDSGASMTFKRNGVNYIRGIVSRYPIGRNRSSKMVFCKSMKHSLFTDVARYLSWIEDVTTGSEENPQCIRTDTITDFLSGGLRISNKYRFGTGTNTLVNKEFYGRGAMVALMVWLKPQLTKNVSVSPPLSKSEDTSVDNGIHLGVHLTQNVGEMSSCGQRLPDLSQLMGSTEPITHRWPWHAAIFHHRLEGHVHAPSLKYVCGGTVITSNSIITSAVCVAVRNLPMTNKEVSVSLGRLKLDENESQSTQNFQVAKIILHPKYTSIDFRNDIAIIRLSTYATFNNYVKPICLWPSNIAKLSDVIGKVGTVIGWGITDTGETSNVLRQASFPVIDTLTCLQKDRSFVGRFLSQSNFCAGPGYGPGLCIRGRAGGSITFKVNGTFYIRGIMSVGKMTINRSFNRLECDPTSPTLFTDVAQHLAWIEKETIECQPSLFCSSSTTAK